RNSATAESFVEVAKSSGWVVVPATDETKANLPDCFGIRFSVSRAVPNGGKVPKFTCHGMPPSRNSTTCPWERTQLSETKSLLPELFIVTPELVSGPRLVTMTENWKVSPA